MVKLDQFSHLTNTHLDISVLEKLQRVHRDSLQHRQDSQGGKNVPFHKQRCSPSLSIFYNKHSPFFCVTTKKEIDPKEKRKRKRKVLVVDNLETAHLFICDLKVRVIYLLFFSGERKRKARFFFNIDKEEERGKKTIRLKKEA